MAEPYAAASDVALYWHAMTQSETDKCNALLIDTSDFIRARASLCGFDYDEFIEEYPYMASVVKNVVIDVVIRYMRQNLDDEPMSQQSQSVGGYSASWTSAVPGGGLINSFMERDWKVLGIRRQVVVSQEYDYWNNNSVSE